MKKHLNFVANSDPAVMRIFPEVTHWVFSDNNHVELCAIVRTKLWRRVRVASLTTNEGVYMTGDCHRQVADFIDSQEKELSGGKQPPTHKARAQNRPKLPLSMERCIQLLHERYGRPLSAQEATCMQETYSVIERQLRAL